MLRGRDGLFTNLMFSSKSDSPGPDKPKSLGQARTILWAKLHFSGAEHSFGETGTPNLGTREKGSWVGCVCFIFFGQGRFGGRLRFALFLPKR